MQTSIKLKLRPSSVRGRAGTLCWQMIRRRSTRVVSTPWKVFPREWNSRNGTFNITTADVTRARYLERVATALNQERQILEASAAKLENISPCCTVDDLIKQCFGGAYSGMLSDYAERQAQELDAAGRHRTARAYRGAAQKVNQFLGRDIRLEQIDARLVKSFEAYMHQKGNELNTISFYNRNLRAIWNKAIGEQLISRPPENPFAGAYTGIARTQKRAVRAEVIKKLEALPLDKEKQRSLRFARDMFLLSFYLQGISFADLAYLRPEDMRGGKITYTRRKTGQHFMITLTPEMREIIARYKRHAAGTGFLLPILASHASHRTYGNALQRQNARLRRLSLLLGLDRPLTTYVARHSSASIAWTQGIELSVISRMLGHTSERTTLIYLDTLADNSVTDRANRIVIRAIKKGRESA